jgi:hypothetical protein
MQNPLSFRSGNEAGQARPEWVVARRASKELQAHFGRLTVGSYDVSTTCNLKCEGCFYFDGSPNDRHDHHGPEEEWDTFFSAEARRGVNFAMLAGAEPTLQVGRIRSAHRHFPFGVVYTNGTIALPPDIRYRVHISIWGVGQNGARLRAADILSKSLSNYRHDPRAVCVFTISALNIDDIVPAAALAHDYGLPITFSYFSPPVDYADKLESGAPPDRDYFRISTAQSNQRLRREHFAAARRRIVEAIARFPQTVWYSLHYDDWVTQDSIYEVDPETGIAKDCGIRLTGQRNFTTDLQRKTKCCMPQIDCRTCRAYAFANVTYLMRGREATHLPGGRSGWAEVRRVWERIFLMDPRESGCPAVSAGGADVARAAAAEI